ncbi:hypothetical protein MO973_37155 [Paenibacillus sp. TRM 82003]|uniref:hypothetical protein n=1 Tax=Kineococcus sp. TRM81007 TaxID=2925831 RepID=UPI001F56ABF9|nr:hypothetical protein [Kineococcus sp. TRM81007]MCI2239857.1 hypothetical protein [Kineococcus sp. TRM81007]MCI3925839.1 hypothetical protein [Paenibacillus sp. TRM 82003]
MSVPGGQPRGGAGQRREEPAGTGSSVEDERSADDRDEGWGERAGGLDDDWYLSQRPPHWD